MNYEYNVVKVEHKRNILISCGVFFQRDYSVQNKLKKTLVSKLLVLALERITK